MSLKDLDDKQIIDLLKDPNKFISKKKNLESLLGFDSAAKRKFSDVMKFELNMTDKQIKKKLDEVMAVRLKEIDVIS